MKLSMCKDRDGGLLMPLKYLPWRLIDLIARHKKIEKLKFSKYWTGKVVVSWIVRDKGENMFLYICWWKIYVSYKNINLPLGTTWKASLNSCCCLRLIFRIDRKACYWRSVGVRSTVFKGATPDRENNSSDCGGTVIYPISQCSESHKFQEPWNQ